MELCNRAATFLNQARVAISAHSQQQQQRAAIAERWTIERIVRLSAHLLTALDERQVNCSPMKITSSTNLMTQQKMKR